MAKKSKKTKTKFDLTPEQQWMQRQMMNRFSLGNRLAFGGAASGSEYLRQHPDVAAHPTWSADPYGHFVAHGQSEGRQWPTSGEDEGGVYEFLREELGAPAPETTVTPEISAQVSKAYETPWRNYRTQMQNEAALRGMRTLDTPIEETLRPMARDLMSNQAASEIGVAQFNAKLQQLARNARLQGGLGLFGNLTGFPMSMGPIAQTTAQPKEQWMEAMNRIYGEIIGNTASGMSLGMGVGGMMGGGGGWQAMSGTEIT